MKEIDELYKGLKTAQTKSPDVWGEISKQLPKSSPAGESNATKGLSAAATKTLLIAVGVITVGVGAYFIATTNSNSKYKTQTAKVKSQDVFASTQQDNHTTPVATTNKRNSVAKVTSQNDKPSVVASNSTQLTTEFVVNDNGQNNIATSKQSFERVALPNENQTIVTPHAQYQPVSQPTEQQQKHQSMSLPPLRVSNVITPNGDGENDVFVIQNIEFYPDNTLIIIDTRGKSVFKSKCYKNNFGASNLPSGTYFYKLRYKCLDEIKEKTGALTVIKK